jgi:hypothetical protein
MSTLPPSPAVLCIGTQPKPFGRAFPGTSKQIGVGRSGKRDLLEYGRQNSAFAACVVTAVRKGIAR